MLLLTLNEAAQHQDNADQVRSPVSSFSFRASHKKL